MPPPTHFPSFLTSSKNLNKLITPPNIPVQGFLNGEIYWLFGKPKVSKTTICLDTALNAIKRGAKVLYVDGDMGGVSFIRLNQILDARKNEGLPPPLPSEIFLEPKLEQEKQFKQHLAKHGLQLEIAHSISEFKKFHFQLSNRPHLVIVDSATLYFRQDMILGRGKYGSGVSTVDFAVTSIRQYLQGKLKIGSTTIAPPHKTATGILTAQTKSALGNIAKQAEINLKKEQGIPINERDLQVQRPFIGGEGIGYLSETFLEILHDNSDVKGERRIALIWGSRNVKDHSKAYFKTVSKGITDV